MVNNLDCGDKDSLGLFQQRPSMGWGTPAQLQTPTYAINKFYEALMQIYPGMRNNEPGAIAQAVQRAEAGNQYTRNIGVAQRLVREAAAAVGDVSTGNNNNNNNNDDDNSSTAPKPTPTKSNGGGGAINVGGNPTGVPSAQDDTEEEDCDDSLEPCTQYYIPRAGDNCYKVSADFSLTLAQFYDLNPQLDNVSPP
jgi:LysM repeat protein